jgi:hypothetical protein
MSRPGSQLDRFVRRVHRRYVMLRAAEGMGLGALIGTAVGAVLLALLWWEGRSALGPSMAAVGFGALVGLVWGVARRPGLPDAATEADRQFGLADLLGSALGAGHGSVNGEPDPWAASLLAVAEARCRTLAPSAVVLNRLGARAWGGIGLATALLLTLALLAGSPGDTRAARANTPDRTANGEAANEPSAQPEHPLLVAVGPQRAAPAESDNDDRSHPTPGAAPPDPNATDATNTPDAHADPRSTKSPTGESAGGTTGSGQTKPPGAQPLGAPQPPAASPSPGNDPRPTKANNTAGGAGRAATGPSSQPPGMTGTASAGSPSPRNTPPWESDRWGQDAQQAREAIDHGRIPPEYRDVVRKYFEHE